MPKLYQLANDPETYGADANKWLVVSDDGEEEITGPMREEDAEAFRGMLQRTGTHATVNTRLLAALKELKRCGQPYFTNRLGDQTVTLACIEADAAIAEAEAQPQPDRPSYDELLDGLALLETAARRLADGSDSQPTYCAKIAAKNRALLKRAGRG